MTGDWVKTDSGLVVPASVAEPKPPCAVDLFCGAGGFSLGLLQAGFHVLAGVDANPVAALTYLINLGAYPLDIRFVEEQDRIAFEKLLRRHLREENGVLSLDLRSGSARVGVTRDEWPKGYAGVPVFFLGDVRKLRGEQALEAIGLKRGQLDLVVGGPPCQGYSRAGKHNVADPRNNLVFEFARLVCEMQPKSLCMEEVPGILSMVTPEGVPVVEELCRILERGDFGEFNAIRTMLTQDASRRVVKQPSKPKSARRPDEANAVQTSLFGDS